jgi:hypothetical protein
MVAAPFRPFRYSVAVIDLDQAIRNSQVRTAPFVGSLA